MTCMTPRALAADTAALLKPLSCQATADASEPDTPCCAAIEPISPDVVCVGVGLGAAVGTTAAFGAAVVLLAGAVPDAPAPEPVGSFSGVPVMTNESALQAVHPRKLLGRHPRARGDPAERVTGLHGVGAERGWRTGGCGRRAGRRSGGGDRRGRLGDGRHLDGRAEYHLRVRRQAVVARQRVGGQVVCGGDRPERLARLHDVPDFGLRGCCHDGEQSQCDCQKASSRHTRSSRDRFPSTTPSDARLMVSCRFAQL